MRKILFVFVLLTMSVSLFAQKDVTTFLGIPVDGSKSAMIQKLKAKGFVSSAIDKDVLQGEFNGTKVNVFVVTNNNKVYRIMVCDAYNMDEMGIKNRFNILCHQFMNNPKYISVDDFTIDEDEKVSLHMALQDKNYEAVFYQKPSIDSLSATSEEFKTHMRNDRNRETYKNAAMKKPVWFTIQKNYGEYYIAMYYDNEYNHANGEDL